jgi:hypothetical protein
MLGLSAALTLSLAIVAASVKAIFDKMSKR